MKKLIALWPLLLLFCLFACKKQQKVLASTTDKTKAMIKINNDNYEKEWRTIDSLDRQGLPKSALEKVQAGRRQYTISQALFDPDQGTAVSV